MQEVTTSNGGGEPLHQELQDKVRALLGSSPTREELSAFGVSHVTLANALAGFSISKGSRTLIRLAVEERSQRATST